MLFPWQQDVQSCPSSQNYYRCSSVPYAGCCAHDPCGSGVCTDIASGLEPGSCGSRETVTVTQTILHGAATSTVNSTTGAFSSTRGEPSTATGISSSEGSAPVTGLPVSAEGIIPLTSAVVPITAPTVISDISSISAATTKTLNLVAATPSSTSTTSPCPKPGSSHPKSTTGTIAGSVIGIMAGLALLIVLLSWCFRRKSKVKLTFKRKPMEAEQEQDREDVESKPSTNVNPPDPPEHSQPLPTPISFDFGLPRIPANSTASMPKQWI
ncbi:hypothetical protein A1O3_09151 [Capronia epimyces CBS 606.96]|uniref:Uncharacterized protein n=1 Tax=Capronia epimyces CBS 606.96 TaxID=1182542 RepID=W9XBY7_9EURO|nr:uncharacterized protein A1O3_09151 [Capronia epimyces CBS 606.96]EXJ77992.1 hypothetical protein A1O3_09151 [Capronia epimyces CBS 606.96]